MTNEQKQKVAKTMKELNDAVVNSDLALMFMYEQELTELIGVELSMEFLEDLARNGEGVIAEYILKCFEGGETNETE
ncbi:hypothetical protein SAMN04488137_1016 [Fictibacillus solisalsi]|uniref:Uncharacterized protein n=1 Tax=Fictibacillus solisalsi TaxID=459525 RepID=A0A1G9UMK5_9BACL|nr:hypothetical protein [Fictibacillus solisalsi]SDM61111.1 hypothetical protein SAMN04488137_1016 [Fictibacillus solisalsi]